MEVAASHPGAEPNERIFPARRRVLKGDINKSGTAEANWPSSLELWETGFFYGLAVNVVRKGNGKRYEKL
jgi:hypothetical protein